MERVHLESQNMLFPLAMDTRLDVPSALPSVQHRRYAASGTDCGPLPPRRPGDIPGPTDRLSGLTILVVDDDPLVLLTTENILAHWGARVLPAASGEQALELIAAGARPDLIIADYRLGRGYTGLDVLAEIAAALGSEVPALVITGDAVAEVARKVKAAGLTMVRKPVDSDTLLDLIDKTLGR